MDTRVAINGFGRIGRLVLRSIVEHGRDNIKVVAINDMAPPDMLAHLMKYDSVHGNFPYEVSVDGDRIRIGDHNIRSLRIANPAELPHKEEGVDIAFECTGIFTDREKAGTHLAGGAKRVLVSAPSKGADKTIVFGVNHDTLTKDDLVVSNASCTTNCLSPVAKVLNDTIGIKRGFMTTIHSYTGDQPTLDRPQSDFYRARGAATSMIPTSTGAAKAVGLVLPELAGKLNGAAVRVPTPNVSLVDLVFDASRETTPEEVNDAICQAADGYLNGILAYTNSPLVSVDFNHNPASSIFATDQTHVMDGTLVRVVSWYDNEWGFATRMSDTALEIAKFL